MLQRPMKYNPAFLTEEELVHTFVVRDADLALIVEAVRDNQGESNQHVLVIGARGMGKTMLVLRTVAEVRRDDALDARWYPLVFAEESYEVTTPGEFWLEALFHLWRQTKEDRWRRTYEDLRREPDDARLRERALGQLMDFADGLGKRILLVVENLNMLLGDQINDNDAWVLRHTLQHEPRVMMLASATSRSDEFENAGKAMFEVFKPLQLKPLTEDECRKVWTMFAGETPPSGQIRPIQILTGGSPRLLAIISAFAAGRSFSELMEDLTQLVDDHTEYFKSHLDNLPTVERKVYLALAEIWSPATARNVAEACRLDVNKTSSLLQRLVSRGAVVVADEGHRTRWYQVAERLYNIYYLMRRRGSPSSRVKAIVNFMISFYDEEKLLRIIVDEALRLDRSARENHYLACESILSSASDEERERLIRALPRAFLEGADVPSPLQDLLCTARAFQEPLSDSRRAKMVASEERTIEEEAEDLFQRAESLRSAGHREEAEKAYRRTIGLKPGHVWAWIELGGLLQEDPQRYAEAEAAYRRAIELAPNDEWPLIELGDLFQKSPERYAEAEAVFRKATELVPRSVRAWIQLGELFEKDPKRYDEAESAYRAAVEVQPDRAWARIQLGVLLEKDPKRYAEAESTYREAVEVEPGYAWAWIRLGALLEKDPKRYAEAESAYREAVEVEPGYAWAWIRLGALLEKDPKRYAEAEDAFRKAIDIEPNDAFVWGQLGQLLHEKIGRYSDAEHAYRKAIELSSSNAWAWAQLGQLLHGNLGRYAEAEEAYRKAIELEPDSAQAWRLLLVLLLITQNERRDEGIQLAEDYSKDHAHDALQLSGLAWAFYCARSEANLSRAEKWAREAVRLSSGNPEYHHALACISCAVNKGDQALASARMYFNGATSVLSVVDSAIELGIQLAVAGVAREAVEILQASPSAAHLEPLIVGLRLFLGEDVKAPAEIIEVGKDVVKRINDRKGRASGEEGSAVG